MIQVTYRRLRMLDQPYPQRVVETAQQFTELLFLPSQLGEVTHPTFTERLDGEGVTLDGLPALQRYRKQFGKPVLEKIDMIAVPPHMAAKIPGTDRPYTIDLFFELRFGLRPQDLPPGTPPFPHDTPAIDVVVRMREAYLIAPADPDDPHVPHDNPDKLWVYGRSYWPVGEICMLEPHGQHAFVGRQVEYFRRHNRTMIKLMDPLGVIMNNELSLA